jgi:hypothetical protein
MFSKSLFDHSVVMMSDFLGVLISAAGGASSDTPTIFINESGATLRVLCNVGDAASPAEPLTDRGPLGPNESFELVVRTGQRAVIRFQTSDAAPKTRLESTIFGGGSGVPQLIKIPAGGAPASALDRTAPVSRMKPADAVALFARAAQRAAAQP